jgi:hypothetical protein
LNVRSHFESSIASDFGLKVNPLNAVLRDAAVLASRRDGRGRAELARGRRRVVKVNDLALQLARHGVASRAGPPHSSSRRQARPSSMTSSHRSAAPV